ncbi:MAG: PQQ-dependent sugar dehydrogenase [Acidimicrobiia bacterium]
MFVRPVVGLLLLAACSSTTPATPGPREPTATAPSETAPAATTLAPQTTPAEVPTATPPTTTSTTTTTLPSSPLQGLTFEVVATGFVRPNYALPLPGTDALLVMAADGTVWRVLDGAVDPEPYLDLSDTVLDTGIEQGLLGMAFHPQDPSRLFVYFTDSDEDANLVELQAATAGADATTAQTILTVEQPANRHQAGMLTFGPDGYLYLSIGDGGDGGTQGQNPDSVLGTILRIDIDGGAPYAIPPDNPFVDGGGAPEVLVYGLRNPWRISIDLVTELLFIGDVGQDSWEEINVAPLDLHPYNFGWPLTEGAHCFLERGCDPADFDGPTLEFNHDDGCSVTGGFVYRGKAIPEIAGHYFFSDWCGRWVRSFVYADGDAIEQQEWAGLDGFGQINSFGLDANGELLVTTWGGELARIVPVRE